MSALHFLERTASAWATWGSARAIDGLLALAAAGIVWLFLRGRVSPHVGSALFLLCFVPLVVPVSGLLPDSLARAMPRARIEAALAGWLSSEEVATRGSVPPSASDAAARAATPGWSTLPPSTLAPGSEQPGGNLEPARDRNVPEGGGPSLVVLLFVAWCAVVATLLVRLAVTHRRTLRWLRRARPLGSGELGFDLAALARRVGLSRLSRLPRVVESDEVAAPALVGWRHPTLVLSPRLRRELSAEELEFVVLHELAHLRRKDLWIGALRRLVQVTWFFHPTPWVAGSLVERQTELACDDVALAALPRATGRAGARALLKVVELSTAAATPLGAVGMSGAGRIVRSRLMRMVDLQRSIQSGLTRSAALTLAVGAGGVALAMQAGGSQAASALAPGNGVELVATRDEPRPAPIAAPDLSNGPAAPAQIPAPAAAVAPAPTSAAIRRGLDWLVRHQDRSGAFDPQTFVQHCRDASCTGTGRGQMQPGVTGLAALALLGAKADAADPAFAAAAKRAVEWLVSVQDDTLGCIGPMSGQHFMYNHAYATLALVDAFARSQDAALKPAIERALGLIARAQNPYAGWRYSIRPDGDNDSSVTGTLLYVLARARAAGFTVDAGSLANGRALLDRFTDEATGRTGYQQKGGPPARMMESIERFPAAASESLTAIALSARLATGDPGNTPTVLRGTALLLERLPRWVETDGSIDQYYWFHATAALHQVGGTAWEEWRSALVRELLAHQETTGDADGSFAPIDPWGGAGGRVYSTAIDLLALEETVRAY